jgi:hypothetical protein
MSWIMFITTFVIVECNIHGVSAYADGSEASLGVGIIVRTVEELERILGHIILTCVCAHTHACMLAYVLICVHVFSSACY